MENILLPNCLNCSQPITPAPHCSLKRNAKRKFCSNLCYCRFYAKKLQKYTYNVSSFTNEDSVSYYLLGAFITDGCVSLDNGHKRVSITSQDKDWLELIRNIICKDLPISKSNFDNTYKLSINSPAIADWLISKECTPKKSLTVKCPVVPEQYLPDFLRGCFDGDGSIGIYKDRKYTISKLRLFSSSYDFISTIHNILLSHNIESSFNAVNKKPSKIAGRTVKLQHKHYALQIAHRATITAVNWIWYNGNAISMPRKETIAKKIIIDFVK